MARKDFHHPFTPYDIQQQFMEAVYKCIEEGKVGIFESPTGTGKSLSLICGALTWLRENKRKTYDEAIATIDIDDEEPEWMRQHAVKARAAEIRRLRDEFEARLEKVRQRERRIKERANGGTEPAFKRRKQDHEKQDDSDEAQFVLDDYDSDDERKSSDQTEFSSATTTLMTKLGLLNRKDDGGIADEEPGEMKIFFCSRTHSQLSQFVGELKRVGLPPGFPPADLEKSGTVEPTEELKHLTLGSRKNLCINEKVNELTSQTAINEQCIELQQSTTPTDKKCGFLPNKDSEDVVLEFRDHALAKIRDIEDLATLGSELQICPYYASRPGIGHAEMVTLPYPLLLQKAAREALGINLKGHVVIIDEAHNLMSAVEGIYSVQITDAQLNRARDSLIVYLQKFRNRLKASNRSYVTQVVRVIDSLLQFTRSVQDEKTPGSDVAASALLAGKSVDQINLSKLIRYINESKLARKVEGYSVYKSQIEAGDRSASQKVEKTDVPTLTHVQNFLLALMNPSREGRFLWSKEDKTITIRYLLLDPSEHFREVVESARAVILAGGTMSPMDEYKQQLFPYLDSVTTFSCGHLIPPSSLYVRAITSDIDGRVDFTFKSRTDATALRLGRALARIAKKVKGGMIVFFPSYGYLESTLRFWKTQPIFSQLEAIKPVFCDERSGAAESTFRTYSEVIAGSSTRGAILLSVIGGKLSEGINFADDLGRCVVVVGLPYPNLETPEWKSKMQYLEEKATQRGETKGTASREYAENVCMRSVNQAIGRVIRHKDDWASILLFDARYADKRIRDKLPGWIRSSVDEKADGKVEGVVAGLGAFFK
ncbi:ATP-dependent RNA helicase chl1 like protein [Zymoseptoria brevis]|uniref:ATP-dependent DNA helicase CHL1 n=1 Tax=Zymoseptoria brevis TaxID=1047168 RepID=A0A0F4GQZ1_9PEZI|nr:ATP-dependent RNA helicase chl1 like protein [Zymoseptoria brevis]